MRTSIKVLLGVSAIAAMTLGLYSFAKADDSVPLEVFSVPANLKCFEVDNFTAYADQNKLVKVTEDISSDGNFAFMKYEGKDETFFLVRQAPAPLLCVMVYQYHPEKES